MYVCVYVYVCIGELAIQKSYFEVFIALPILRYMIYPCTKLTIFIDLILTLTVSMYIPIIIKSIKNNIYAFRLPNCILR